ncbi:MAG: LysR substrate-binding domain-containing protein [Paracoccaceae bacterium]
MANITLKQLRYFNALVQHGHFGRAAEACAVSQPALSMQIKEMEENLGTPLLERLPRKVHLTTTGREVFDRARDILRSVEELEDLARATQDQLVGKLRIGVIPTIAPYLLPAIVDLLGRSFQGADILFRETMTSTLIRELSEGHVDMAIVALPISEPWLTEAPLFQEEFVLVRPEDDRAKPVPDPARLREMRLLLLEEGHCFRDQALTFCNIHTNAPRETLDGTNLSTLVQMVGAGVGITLIPEMAVPVETRSAAVSVARFPAPRPVRTVGLIWRKTSPLTAHYQRFAKVLKEASRTGTADVTP